jgi:hypothetical protein
MAGRVGAGLVGLAVLGGGLAYAVSQSGGGGESSPEAAAQALFDAVAAEDLIGMLDVLPTGERRAFQDPLQDIAEELARLGVVGDDLDLESVGGLDLEFEDLQFESEDIADGFATVRLVGGTAIASVEPGDLPIGDELRDVIEEVSGEPLEIDPVEETREEFDREDDDFQMVAVQEDGSWRISVFYTIAEVARRDAGLDAPDFGNGIEAAGADSPEAAVEALIRAAAEEQDLTAVIALLPPDEMAVLHDYAPLFLDEAQASFADADAALEVTDLELEAVKDGDTASVAIASFAVEGTIDGEQGRVAFDGDCFTFEGPDGEAEEQCTDDLGDLGDMGALEEVLRFDEGQVAGISTVKVDGKWYVSPTRTVLDSLVVVLRAFDDDALSRLPEIFEDLLGFSEDMFSEVGTAIPELDQEIDDLDLGVDDRVIDEETTETTETTPGASTTTFEWPSIEVLTAMLVNDQGFTDEEASCIAGAIYAAGFSDDVLSTLQTGEIPSEVSSQISDIVDSCAP